MINRSTEINDERVTRLSIQSKNVDFSKYFSFLRFINVDFINSLHLQFYYIALSISFIVVIDFAIALTLNTQNVCFFKSLMKKKNVNQLLNSQFQNRKQKSSRDELAETKSIHDIKRRKRVVKEQKNVKTINETNESSFFNVRDARKKIVNAVIVFNEYIY